MMLRMSSLVMMFSLRWLVFTTPLIEDIMSWDEKNLYLLMFCCSVLQVKHYSLYKGEKCSVLSTLPSMRARVPTSL